MNNNSKPVPGDIAYKADGIDRYAPLSEDERKHLLRNLHRQFSRDQSTAYFAFEALCHSCWPSVCESKLGPEDLVEIPLWAAKAITFGWLNYKIDDVDLKKAFGLAKPKGESPLKKAKSISDRNCGIAADILELGKQGYGITKAQSIVAKRYFLETDVVRKVWKNFDPSVTKQFDSRKPKN